MEAVPADVPITWGGRVGKIEMANSRLIISQVPGGDVRQSMASLSSTNFSAEILAKSKC
jgi:hypothetical protein